MQLRLKILVLLVGLMLIWTGAWASPEISPGGDSSTVLKGPRTLLSETHHKFEPLFEGDDVTHDFVIENKGDAPLVIKNIKPG